MNVYIRKKDLDYSAMRGPCPEGFHVPHYKEWQAIIDIWLELGLPEQDGELYATYLKLPFAGERGSSGALTNQTQLGYYWSSPSNDDSFFFWIGHYDDPTATTFGWRAVARSLRAFKDVPAKPDSSWTVIYDGSAVATGAGIFWNATLGLISLSSDGFSRKTIQDKNLGATNVGDYGSHFQRGNNYGFPSSGTLSDTSSTQVDASGYGPGNYYSNSTYITGSEDWSSVRNDNLWGHSTGTVPIMTTMKNAYIGQGIWKPGENTLLYTSMKDSISVDAGTKTFTNTSVTNTTIDGVKCGYFNGSARLDTTVSGFTDQNHTISFRYRCGTINQYIVVGSNPCGITSGEVFYVPDSSHFSYLRYPGSTSTGEITVATTPANRHHYLYSGGVLYVDGVASPNSTSVGWSANGYFCIGGHNSNSSCTRHYCTGYMREVIFEDGTRDADKVLSYFNETKSEFGL